MYAQYLEEVTQALRVLGEPERAASAAKDKNSELEFLAVRVPKKRQCFKDGFSFYQKDDTEILDILDYIWKESPYFEVMSLPLEYYKLHPDKLSLNALKVMKTWVFRVDNWGHCDGLGGIFALLNEKYKDKTFPFLKRLNQSASIWSIRLSIVSLVHYVGKNSFYLSADEVIPMLEKHCANKNKYIANAVGWVLREMGRNHMDHVQEFISKHDVSRTALRKGNLL